MKIDKTARSIEEGLCIYNFMVTKDMPKQGANPKYKAQQQDQN